MTFTCYRILFTCTNSIINSDCNPGIKFSIPGFGIEKFVIPGFRDPVSGLGLQIGHHSGIP